MIARKSKAPLGIASFHFEIGTFPMTVSLACFVAIYPLMIVGLAVFQRRIYPHVHMIVPGGVLSEEGTRWIGLSTELLVGRPRAVTAVPTPGLADVGRGPRGRPTPVFWRAGSAR